MTKRPTLQWTRSRGGFTGPVIVCLLMGLFYCSAGKISVKPAIQKGPLNLGHGVHATLDAQGLRLSRANREFWAASLEGPFIIGRVSTKEADYNMATIDVDRDVTAECNNQSIDAFTIQNQRLIITGMLSGPNCQAAYRIEFNAIDAQQLELSISVDKPINELTIIYSKEETERFFGFGEQFSHFDMTGQKPYMLSEEQGVGRGDQPITLGADLAAGAGGNEYSSYAPFPFYISTEQRALLWLNNAYSTFDLGHEKHIEYTVWNRNVSARIWIGSSPPELLELYTEFSGRMPELPDWAYGTWLGLQGGRQKAEGLVAAAKQAGNPVTALWIQDWVGKRKTVFGSQLWWRWTADETSYPQFNNFTAQMKGQGVRVLGYINPFLADQGTMFAEARRKGFLVKDVNGQDYTIKTVGFPAYLLDLTNPQCRTWIKSIIKTNLLGRGLSGWMADFGEWLPLDSVLHDGTSPWIYHNRYPVEWARLNREAIDEAGKTGEAVFFTRAGYTFSNKYSTLFWEGDQMVSWGTHDGLASTVVGLLTSGISGYSLNHSDIGGYTTINNPIADYHRSKELFLRWAELNAFTVVFRTHEGNRPEENWQFYQDANTQQWFAYYGRLHYALKSYLKHLVQQAAQKGAPVVRPLYFHYPQDAQTFGLQEQFLLGAHVLVAPVLNKGQAEVDVYIPAGTWQAVFEKRTVKGPRWVRDVPAPMGRPVVFVHTSSDSPQGESESWGSRVRTALRAVTGKPKNW